MNLYDHNSGDALIGNPRIDEDLELCTQCKNKFPCDLVSPMFETGDYTSCCPICALNRVRKVHGIPNFMFTAGGIARTMYERAISFLSQTREI